MLTFVAALHCKEKKTQTKSAYSEGNTSSLNGRQKRFNTAKDRYKTHFC